MITLKSLGATSQVIGFYVLIGAMLAVAAYIITTIGLLIFRKVNSEKYETMIGSDRVLIVVGISLLTLMLGTLMGFLPWFRYAIGHEFAEGLPNATFSVVKIEERGTNYLSSITLKRSDSEVVTIVMDYQETQEVKRLQGGFPVAKLLKIHGW